MLGIWSLVIKFDRIKLMDDIGGEVSGAIKSVGSQVKSTIFGEVKKIGRSAVGSISGKTQPHQSSHSTGMGAVGSAPKPGESKLHQHNYQYSVLGEIKKFGKTLGSQVTGKPLTADEITSMASRDKYLSKQDADAVREKILQIYREYNEKKNQEKSKREWGFHLMEQDKGKVEQAKLKSRGRINVNPPGLAKNRAETGKNFGSE